jgi:hypothetical protein
MGHTITKEWLGLNESNCKNGVVGTESPESLEQVCVGRYWDPKFLAERSPEMN